MSTAPLSLAESAPGGTVGPRRAARPPEAALRPATGHHAPSRSVRVAVAGDTHLTAREVQVLRLIAGGHANAKIARELNLSVNTVKSHVSRMAQRVGARDRAALVAVGIRARVVVVRRAPGVSLDPAERRLVDLVAQGLYTAEIARRLKVSGPSATYRVQLLMARLGAVDRAHMVLRAAEVGAWPVRPVTS